MARVHPTSLVDDRCRLGDDVEIGPWCMLDGDIEIGDGTRLVAGVHLSGRVRIGSGSIIYPHACLGFAPQDLKHTPGDPSAGVEIGNNAIVREHVTIHAATSPDEPTRIGNDAFLLVGCHMGHDAVVGDNVTITNSVLLAGHTTVQDGAILSGNVMVHQFCRVGRLAFCSGGALVAADVPPFCIAEGRNSLHGINVVGLRRAGFAREEITLIREAYRMALNRSLQRGEMLEVLDDLGRSCGPVAEMADFIRGTKRSVSEGSRRGNRT